MTIAVLVTDTQSVLKSTLGVKYTCPVIPGSLCGGKLGVRDPNANFEKQEIDTFGIVYLEPVVCGAL